MKKALLLIALCLPFAFSYSQSRYLVYLADKPSTNLVPEDCLSAVAIKKRKQRNIALDEYDLPVCADYVKQLQRKGEVLKSSKWLNAVVLETSQALSRIEGLPFVRKVEKLEVNSVKNKYLEQPVHSKGWELPASGQRSSIDYGYATTQNEQIGIDCIHDKGFLGDSVIIAVLDAGWKGFDTIAYFDSLILQNRILDTWDFISNTNNVYQYYWHGTGVTSVIIAEGDSFVGAAPHAQLLLYVTEDVSREVHEEELDLVRGLERADSVGADLVNISLSYYKFDTLEGDYFYPDLDGETTISAQGIQVATSRGMIINASAGNSGSYAATPCDADSILCVGATDTNNVKAGFSSHGPTYDARIKPDVAAVGSKGWCIRQNGLIAICNGTSFSSPLMTGMVACLRQAHPLRTAQQIRSAVIQSGHQYSNPDTLLGYGIPNACYADSILTLMDSISVHSSNIISGAKSLSIYPNPTDGFATITNTEQARLPDGQGMSNVEVFDIYGRLVPFNFDVQHSVLDIRHCPAGIYFVKVGEQTEKLVLYR